MNRLGRWDLFCKVVDNFGDIGVCWRLARQLATEHKIDVRMWVDDLKTFSQLVPTLLPEAAIQHVGQVEVRSWCAEFPAVEAADVVIEAFACELPNSYIESMMRRNQAPVWMNLEYLSAESWVEDCHRLKSPHYCYPLTKHFFFPGFTEGTGGLLREQGLLEERDHFDDAAAKRFWHDLGIAPSTPDELRVSLFCYQNHQLPGLFEAWAAGDQPVSVLVCSKIAIDQAERWLGETLTLTSPIRRKSLTVAALPFLSQDLYDRLLWACDVNFVRGEDSFVRAQWARKPFVWQIYPQADGAHLIKLEAFLARYLQSFPDSGAVRQLWHDWNSVPGGGGIIGPAWRDFVSIRPRIGRHAADWVSQLDRTGNLADNLIRFVRAE